MNGPSFECEYIVGQEYSVPNGYSGKDGFIYIKCKFMGVIQTKINFNDYLVFEKDDNKYIFCLPKIKVLGHKIQISLNPVYYGSLKDIQGQFSAMEWETFCSETKVEDYPNLK
jgi:hypothetical protein